MHERRFLAARLPMALLLMILLCASAYPCLNEYPTDFVARRIETDGLSAGDFVRKLTAHEDRAYWAQRRANVQSQLKWDIDYDLRNNLAVAFAHLGQPQKAIALLEEIEQKRPDKYATAVNLGTAYELNGQDEKALRWITEGVRRNSESHLGTEWLHVKILEAKLALAKDPAWLKNHTVLGADFGTEGKPRRPEPLPKDHLGAEKSLAQIEEALTYQLHERLEFVKRPDALVADLLFDLGNVLALREASEHARAVYQLSLDYGPTHNALVQNRLTQKNEVKGRVFTAPATSRSYLPWALAALLVAAAGLFVALKVRRGRLRERLTNRPA